MPFGGALTAGIGGVASVIGGILGGRPKTTTQTSSNTTSNSATGATSSMPAWSPELNDLMGQLLAYSTKSMTNPTAALAPVRNAGLDQINLAYNDVPQSVTTQLASRGYGSSGQMGGQLYKTALARAGATSNFEGNLAQQGIQQQNTGAGLAEQLLGLGKGTTTSSVANGTTTSNGTASSTGPDTSLANGFSAGGSALGSLGQLLAFNNAFNNSGYSPGNMNTSGGGSLRN